MWAVVGVLAALRHRDVTGLGTHVDVALLDGLVPFLSYLAELYLVTGETPARVGSNHHTVPAYGRYAARDGHLVVAAQMDAFWSKFCRAAGRPELASDPRFRTVADRRESFEEVERLVAEVLVTRDVAEWTRLLDQADVPNARVLSVAEALGAPHVRERELVREIDQPGAGRVAVLGPTLRFLGGPVQPEVGPAPRLGEHTRAVLEEVAGFSPAQVDRLIASGDASEPAG
jgi:crotonobetainyl-CoA:carnitine CoA-transferase CaiB-like acyl-CoA transferase